MIQGHLQKMRTQLADPVQYQLPLDDQLVGLNDYLGQPIELIFQGEIACAHCGRLTKKSYSQGFCFVCMRKLAQCDLCILKPETCHFAAGTCREPDWGLAHCMQPHIVYLSNTSGLKVGITRQSQVPTRWIDQGASQALPIFRVQSRLQSGKLEVLLSQHVADKTDWRKLLKGEAEPLDLVAARDQLLEACAAEIQALESEFGPDAIERLPNASVEAILYPVLAYPDKIKAHNFDKQPQVSGKLLGIKGQYLMLDSGVLNVRKFGSYLVEFRTL